MYYLVRHADSYDCYVTKCETLEKLAKELLDYPDDGVSSLSRKEQRELQKLIEKQKS